MKITKEYLRTIIKEEFTKLSAAAKSNIANDIRQNYDSSLADDEAVKFSDRVNSVNKIISDKNLSDMDKEALIKKQNLTDKERNLLLKNPNFNFLTKVKK